MLSGLLSGAQAALRHNAQPVANAAARMTMHTRSFSTRLPVRQNLWEPGSLSFLRRSSESPAPKSSSNSQNSQNTRPRDRLWADLMPIVKQEISRLPRSLRDDPEAVWQQREMSIVKNLPRPPNAYAGRSFEVRLGNVGATFSKLQGVLRRNRVTYELKMAERHEKKGVKRRRLKSERWRQRFAHEVRKKVQLVNQIRARGA